AAADPVLRHPDRPAARRDEDERRRRLAGVPVVARPATAPGRPEQADRGPASRRKRTERATRRRERIGREEADLAASLPPLRRRAGKGELRPADERARTGAPVADLDRAGEIRSRSLKAERRPELRGLAGGRERRIGRRELRPRRKPGHVAGGS